MTDLEQTDPIIDTIIDRTVLLERFEGDLLLLQEIAELFLEDCPRRMHAVREALAAGDAAALHAAAHSLKGSVGNFGGGDAVAAARRLEMMGRDGDLTEAPAACAALEEAIARLVPALTRLAQAHQPVGDHALAQH